MRSIVFAPLVPNLKFLCALAGTSVRRALRASFRPKTSSWRATWRAIWGGGPSESSGWVRASQGPGTHPEPGAGDADLVPNAPRSIASDKSLLCSLFAL